MLIEQHFIVHNKTLFGRKSPQASKAWVKRKLGKMSYPEYYFTAVCSGLPQNLGVGEHFQFDIAIQPDSKLTTDDVEGKISLDYCIFTLIAQIGGWNSCLVEPEILSQKKDTQLPRGRFSWDTGYKKTVDIGVLSHVPATFNGHDTKDTNPSYKVRLEIRLNVASKPGAENPVDINYDCGLVMHPPAIQPVKQRQIERLPTYAEVIAG